MYAISTENFPSFARHIYKSISISCLEFKHVSNFMSFFLFLENWNVTLFYTLRNSFYVKIYPYFNFKWINNLYSCLLHVLYIDFYFSNFQTNAYNSKNILKLNYVYVRMKKKCLFNSFKFHCFLLGYRKIS